MSKKDRAKALMNKDGRKDRQEGMYKKEKQQTKIMYCLCFGVSAIVFVIMGGLYASRSLNASKIDSDYGFGAIRVYDTCQSPNGVTRPYVLDSDVSDADFASIMRAMNDYCYGNGSNNCKDGT